MVSKPVLTGFRAALRRSMRAPAEFFQEEGTRRRCGGGSLIARLGLVWRCGHRAREDRTPAQCLHLLTMVAGFSALPTERRKVVADVDHDRATHRLREARFWKRQLVPRRGRHIYSTPGQSYR